MVDQAAVVTAQALILQGLLHGSRVGGKSGQIVTGHAQAVFADQKEPVAAPGDIADHPAIARHLHLDRLAITVGRHIAHADRAILVQGGGHRAHRCFDPVLARADTAQISQGYHQADGAVAAHAQVTAVVEEDYPGTGTGVDRLA